MSVEPEQMFKLIDANELSEITGLPVSTIWRGCRENKIPHFRFGKRLRFDPKEVLDTLRVEPVQSREE